MTNTKGYIFLVRPCGTIVAIKALLDGAEGETVVSVLASLFSSIRVLRVVCRGVFFLRFKDKGKSIN